MIYLIKMSSCMIHQGTLTTRVTLQIGTFFGASPVGLQMSRATFKIEWHVGGGIVTILLPIALLSKKVSKRVFL